jgi:superoxide dismutase
MLTNTDDGDDNYRELNKIYQEKDDVKEGAIETKVLVDHKHYLRLQHLIKNGSDDDKTHYFALSNDLTHYTLVKNQFVYSFKGKEGDNMQPYVRSTFNGTKNFKGKLDETEMKTMGDFLSRIVIQGQCKTIKNIKEYEVDPMILVQISGKSSFINTGYKTIRPGQKLRLILPITDKKYMVDPYEQPLSEYQGINKAIYFTVDPIVDWNYDMEVQTLIDKKNFTVKEYLKLETFKHTIFGIALTGAKPGNVCQFVFHRE